MGNENKEKQEKLIENLNNPDRSLRLEALSDLKKNYSFRGDVKPYYVNNHVHTKYSFSPYSPTLAVYRAYEAGLETVGIMDHDTIAGAKEFIEAGKILGMPTTIGVETRVNLKESFLENKLVNNPDQKGVAYVAMHGVPHTQIEHLNNFFAPYREARNRRNVKMSDNINKLIAPYGMSFEFERDVLPFTLFHEGGTVTERTLCWGLAKKLSDKFSRGTEIIDFLEKKLGLDLSEKQKQMLSDGANVHYIFDLLGILKAGLVKDFYVDSDHECMHLRNFVSLGRILGVVVAYAYLGDVKESVTGDKKAQKFEDDYIEELFCYLKKEGFMAIAYMPSRNSGDQLKRLRQLCSEMDFFEISGEDINSSRQSFICPQLQGPEFAQLIPSTWALIGHEKAVTKNLNDGMFSEQTVSKHPTLSERIEIFSRIGKS